MCAPAPSYSGASAEERIPVRDGTESFDLGFLNRRDSAAPVSQSSPTQYVAQRIPMSQVAVAEMPEDFHGAPGSSVWRDEVASRVQAHRAKRKRRFDPEASLSLGFETAVMDALMPSLSASACVSTEIEETELTRRVHEIDFDSVEVEEEPDIQLHAGIETEIEPIAAILPDPPRMYERIAMRTSAIPDRRAELETDSNLIEFPRAPMEQNLFAEELAEPITTPRILDVPEPVIEAAPPPLATIQLDADQELPDWVREYEEAESALELPLQVAPLGPRVLSSVTDGVLVLTAAALFSMVVLSVAKFVPQGRTALMIAILLPATLWGIYHYLFLVFSGMTPGMLMAQLELSSFEGCVPMRKTRASRAFAMMLCCVSLGMGFFWAMVDEDNLGWHDRMTRTYLRQS
ncbi:MAG: Rdd [Acidobacteriales bacterium]|nr:Rdd [Terriglobales bacterium]